MADAEKSPVTVIAQTIMANRVRAAKRVSSFAYVSHIFADRLPPNRGDFHRNSSDDNVQNNTPLKSYKMCTLFNLWAKETAAWNDTYAAQRFCEDYQLSRPPNAFSIWTKRTWRQIGWHLSALPMAWPLSSNSIFDRCNTMHRPAYKW